MCCASSTGNSDAGLSTCCSECHLRHSHQTRLWPHNNGKAVTQFCCGIAFQLFKLACTIRSARASKSVTCWFDIVENAIGLCAFSRKTLQRKDNSAKSGNRMLPNPLLTYYTNWQHINFSTVPQFLPFCRPDPFILTLQSTLLRMH